MKEHYIFWQTYPLQEFKTYSGIKTVKAESAFDAEMAVALKTTNLFKRAVLTSWQKTA